VYLEADPRVSPWQRERFKKAVNFAQPELHAKGIKCLDIDVSTCWNSTYSMFERAIQLQEFCTQFCQSSCETTQYLLTFKEWDHDKHIMSLLKPLSKATKMLCGLTLRHPSLHYH
jgi:hypothetical protein